MNQQVIANMRGRIVHLRRLAESITDARTVESLRSMAREIEEDVELLERDVSQWAKFGLSQPTEPGLSILMASQAD